MPPGVIFRDENGDAIHALMTQDLQKVGNELAGILGILCAHGYEDENVDMEWVEDISKEEVDRINERSIYTWGSDDDEDSNEPKQPTIVPRMPGH